MTPDPVVTDPVTPGPVTPDPVSPDPVSPDPETKVTELAAPNTTLRVIVTSLRSNYLLRVYSGTREIGDPGQKLTARFRFKLPEGWDANTIFAVFRNADGTLTAFKAAYDNGMLCFDSDLSGTFAIVSFPYGDTLYTAEFYEQLGALEAIQALPKRR